MAKHKACFLTPLYTIPQAEVIMYQLFYYEEDYWYKTWKYGSSKNPHNVCCIDMKFIIVQNIVCLHFLSFIPKVKKDIMIESKIYIY